MLYTCIRALITIMNLFISSSIRTKLGGVLDE